MDSCKRLGGVPGIQITAVEAEFMHGVGVNEGLKLRVPIGANGVEREVQRKSQIWGAAYIAQGKCTVASDSITTQAKNGTRTASQVCK